MVAGEHLCVLFSKTILFGYEDTLQICQWEFPNSWCKHVFLHAAVLNNHVNIALNSKMYLKTKMFIQSTNVQKSYICVIFIKI